MVQNPGGSSSHVLVCDHAGGDIPLRLGRLGLGDSDLARHIALDIGAGAVASRIGELLDAAVVRQVYSRLVIDCNRPLEAESLIPEISDGAIIPGNLGLTAEARLERIEAIFAPYHHAIAGLIETRLAARRRVAVVSVHSFTPVMDGLRRPWDFGVLHASDSPLSTRMLGLLRAEEGLVIGDNEPYALGGLDYTVPHHAQERGLDYLELEIRQDLIDTPDGQERIAARIARLLAACRD